MGCFFECKYSSRKEVKYKGREKKKPLRPKEFLCDLSGIHFASLRELYSPKTRRNVSLYYRPYPPSCFYHPSS